ncbi:hypothetical protein F4820DRAFT_433499 [Hypoxylon rubiginosum]|uniref:Uncharacterized protein n=1 Tax=Hypoxylon rubiginosum TaxID=110542 RepID=A0ACB9YR59_9PEZI|nr:hypothetical protein F4820DRAFT_433499 [Hypoxylon rubiginosum]
MVLKRKRSESELSFSSSSTFGSPMQPNQFAAMMDMDGASASPLRQFPQNTTPAHLHSRTVKRFRNSRPSDEEVHQRTLSMLYSAQKQHVAHDQQQQQLQLGSLATRPQPQAPPAAHTQSQPQGSQASLHSFWKLPKPAAASVPAVPAPFDQPTSCEDCGQTLREGRGDEDSMDLDGFGAEAETECVACSKHVCSHCSITNLGEQRRCLICAGKKVWVGGLGWAGTSGLKVC